MNNNPTQDNNQKDSTNLDNNQKTTATNSTDNNSNKLNDSAQTSKSATEENKTADHQNQVNKAQDDKKLSADKNDSTENSASKKDNDNSDKDHQSKNNDSSNSDKKDDSKDKSAKDNNKANDKGNGKDEEASEQDKKLLGVDIESILDKEEELKNKLKESSHLERFTTDVSLFLSLIKDYYQGNYRKIPYKSISSIVVGLVYVLNPIDIIPDFIPVIGYIDDALVIAFCLKMVEKDLREYEAWKDQQEGNSSNNDKHSKDSGQKQQNA